THSLSKEEAALLLRLPAKARTLKKHRALLERLAEQNVIRWTFPVAISHDPLKGLPDAPVVGRLRSALSPAGRGKQLAQLEELFTAATEHAPKRHEGRTYGGRGLVYEECRRSLDLELSEAMRARVAGP